MNNIGQLLSRCDLTREDDETLKAIRIHSSGAYEGIMSGLDAIGNMAFWACDSSNYTGEMAPDDLRNLGEMLMYIPRIAEALNANAIDADFNLQARMKNKTPR